MEVPSQFHFRHRRMVEFADTDMAGIMHFANFFRFVESAEHAFFCSLGLRVHGTEGGLAVGWPRIEVSCKYRKPARFEQTLEICLRIEEIRTHSLRYGFWVFVADDPARELLAEGGFSIIQVAIDPASQALRKVALPPAMRQQLEAIAAQPA